MKRMFSDLYDDKSTIRIFNLRIPCSSHGKMESGIPCLAEREEN